MIDWFSCVGLWQANTTGECGRKCSFYVQETGVDEVDDGLYPSNIALQGPLDH